MERIHGVVALLCAACAVMHAQAGLAGKWGDDRNGPARRARLDGRFDGEQVELTPQAAARPVILTRAK